MRLLLLRSTFHPPPSTPTRRRLCVWLTLADLPPQKREGILHLHLHTHMSTPTTLPLPSEVAPREQREQALTCSRRPSAAYTIISAL